MGSGFHVSAKQGCLCFVLMVAVLCTLLVGYMLHVAFFSGERSGGRTVDHAQREPLVVPHATETDPLPLIIPHHAGVAEGKNVRKS